MDKKLVVVYGPPGAGKDTQAKKISEKYGLYHVKTSGLIKKKIYDPQLATDEWIQEQKRLFESGGMCNPDWVTDLVEEELNRKIDLKGFVLNGFPRVADQAKKVFSIFKLLFGMENITTLEIKVKPETTIFRNTHRRICKKCNTPILYSEETKDLKECPVCGGEIITRVDDKEDIIKVRLKKYEELTKPIFQYLKSKDFQVIEIDGEPLPDKVTSQIFNHLDKVFYGQIKN